MLASDFPRTASYRKSSVQSMMWDVLGSGMTDFAQKILERQYYVKIIRFIILDEDATLTTGMVP